jgi:sensor domain CHASE-containing protein
MTSPVPSARLSSRLHWPALLAAALLLLVGGLVEALVRQEQQYREAEETQQAVAEAARVRSTIESELNSTLHLSNGLAAYLKAEDGNVQSVELQAFLAGLFQQGRYLRNIGIAPANRITYVYPLAGNEKALGIHYPDVPSQWPAVERAIRERRPNLAGPLPLLQGGMGLIYRVPVFLESGKYWGMVSTVIKADQLIETIAPSIAQSQLRIAVRGKDGLGSQGEVFWGLD